MNEHNLYLKKVLYYISAIPIRVLFHKVKTKFDSYWGFMIYMIFSAIQLD